MYKSFNPEQVKQFYEKGWVVQKSLFDGSQIRKAIQCFEELYLVAQKLQSTQVFEDAKFVLEKSDQQVVVKRVVWAGGAEPFLLELGSSPDLLTLVGSLLNTDRVCHILNQAHFKMPGDGVDFPWHQDIRHRDKNSGDWNNVDGRGSYVQTLLALDDVTTLNGPLKFIAGSSGWGKIDLGGDGYDTPTDASSLDTTHACVEQMKAGDVVFFGPYTVHGSEVNRSPKPRRVLINGYALCGANGRVYPGSGLGVERKIPR